jgi:hypothetical protein
MTNTRPKGSVTLRGALTIPVAPATIAMAMKMNFATNRVADGEARGGGCDEFTVDVGLIPIRGCVFTCDMLVPSVLRMSSRRRVGSAYH